MCSLLLLSTVAKRAFPGAVIAGFFLAACSGVCKAQDNAAKTDSAKIEILTAVFGTGRGAGECRKEIQAFADRDDAVTTITSSGMGLRNRVGKFRDYLRITYRINGQHVYDAEGKVAVLVIPNGVAISIRKSILEHAAANAAHQPASGSVEPTPPLEMKKPEEPAAPETEPPPPPPETANEEKEPAEKEAKPDEARSVAPAPKEQNPPAEEKAEATGDLAIPLPGPADMVRSGGAGRYLVYRIPDKQLLAVLDLEKRTVVKEISAPPNVVFAASKEKLFIANPQNNQLQRWELAGMNRERHVQIEPDWTPEFAVLGSAGNGPLVLRNESKNAIQIWDIEEMKPVTIQGKVLEASEEMTVSADGKCFCGWNTERYGRAYHVMRIRGQFAYVSSTNEVADFNNRWGMPGFDGGMLFGSQHLAWHRDLSPLSLPGDRYVEYLPVDDPRFLLNSRLADEGRGVAPVICLASDLQAICELPSFKVAERRAGSLGTMEGGEPRLRYVPRLGLLACLNHARDQVLIREFDLEKAIAEQREKYLIVTSCPVSEVVVGTDFTYQLESLSSSAITRYSLDAGPPGMTISDKGVVEWHVSDRPLGGFSQVVITVENAEGESFSHSFRIYVERYVEEIISSEKGAETIAGFVPVDEMRLELPNPSTSVTNGLDGRMLMLSGDKLAILASDGWTVESSVKLDRAYTRILEREHAYIAIANDPCAVYALNKTTFRETKSLVLGFRKLTDLVLHPTEPVCYVSGQKTGELPEFTFVMVNERNFDGRESPDWVGNWLAVEPRGQFLLAGYSDTYVAGSRLLMNPTQWHVVPEYGDLSWLIRYKLDRGGLPEPDEVHEKAGANGNGIRMSPDGTQICYLSHVGSPPHSRNLAGWNSSDFGKIPVSFETKERASTRELAYHPLLPIVASPGSGSAVFFNSNTGAIETGRLQDAEKALAGREVHRIFFSPDGKQILFDVPINGVNYLHRFPLQLSPDEISEMETVRDRRKNAIARQPATPPAAIPLKSLDALKGGIGEPMTTAEIAKEYMDAVVVVESGDSSGSGFVVSSDGYLLTCAHCIPDANDIRLTWRVDKAFARGRRGKLVWIDEEKDIALIKADTESPMTPVRLAIGLPVETGVPVAVIGNPGLGSEILDYTMTEGIISNPSREIDGVAFLQSTAAVNPGSSGGPMFNERGLVVGMVVLKARIEGAGFALPANDVARFLTRHLEPSDAAMSIERDWYDSAGKGPLKAALMAHRDDGIDVRRTADGKEYSLSLERLSEADRTFLKLLPSSNR